MDFFLFLLVNAALFVRPAEVVPDLAGLPIYNALILTNLVVALPKIVGQFNFDKLRVEPVTVCVLGFLVSIVLSHLVHLNLRMAWEGGYEFAKVVLYYLLMVSVLDTTAKLRQFLAALALCIASLTTLALLNYYGVVDIPSLAAVTDPEVDAATGEIYVVLRLCSTGILHDPNDLSLILIVGLGVCLYLVGARPGGLPRPYWLVPAGLSLYALGLTHSKGGFLAFLAATGALFQARFGFKKAVMLAAVFLPLIIVLFAGRQTNISSDDTAQDRIQLWSQGFILFRESPLFGIGQNLYGERVGLIAHNSYVHAFAELGFLGGTFFFGAYASGVWTLLTLGKHAASIGNTDLRRLRPHLTAILVGYAAGMITVSRNYIVPTYMVLGLVATYLRLVAADSPHLTGPDGPIPTLGPRLIKWLAMAGMTCLLAANLLIKLLIQPA